MIRVVPSYSILFCQLRYRDTSSRHDEFSPNLGVAYCSLLGVCCICSGPKYLLPEVKLLGRSKSLDDYEIKNILLSDDHEFTNILLFSTKMHLIFVTVLMSDNNVQIR